LGGGGGGGESLLGCFGDRGCGGVFEGE
jgi:hypothetical protein